MNKQAECIENNQNIAREMKALRAKNTELRAILKSLADACQNSRRHIVLNENEGLACYNETAKEVLKARQALERL